MDDLDRCGEEGDVNFAACECGDGVAKRFYIFRKRPFVDGHLRYDRAAFGEAGEEFGVRRAVFLDGNPLCAQRKRRSVLIECGEQFAPGVGFGRREGGRDAEFFQSGDGLWAAGYDRDFLQGGDEFFAGADGFGDASEGASADACEENRGVKSLVEQPAREGLGFGVGFERDFAHRWGDDGNAAVGFDEFRHFGGAAALERQDTEAGEAGRFRTSFHFEVFLHELEQLRARQSMENARRCPSNSG